MKLFAVFYCLLQLSVVYCFSVAQKHLTSRKRNTHISTATPIGCIHMESAPGEYIFESEGSSEVCGLYVVGQEDELVQITFLDFEIGCEHGGLLALVDGWEAQGQFFPSEDDSELSMDERYSTFCGKEQPKSLFVSTLNAALIQFRIPTPGQGFRISVKFPYNKKPCNIVSMTEEGVFTLHNYGRHSNCSMSVLFPQRITILSMDVGVTAEYPMQIRDTGYLSKCHKRRREDYVEILDGSGLDPTYMWREDALCGLASKPAPSSFYLGCQHSVIRLVSSGKYYNSVTFKHEPLSDEIMESFAGIEC